MPPPVAGPRLSGHARQVGPPPANDRPWHMDGEERTVLETFISDMFANGGIFSTATETPGTDRQARAVLQSLRAVKETR